MGATDMHLQAQQIPRVRVLGSMIQIGDRAIENSDLSQIVLTVLNNDQRTQFHKGLNMDVAYELRGLGRFRFNFSRARGLIVVAVRIIPLEVPSFRNLNLPSIVREIANYR